MSSVIAWQEYLKPLILLVVGLILWMSGPMFALLTGEEVGPILAFMIVGSIVLAVSVIIGVVALIIGCALLGVEGGPITLVLLRLAAIYSVTFAVMTFMQGTFCFGALVTIMIMAGLIAMLFDMDIREGFIMTIITWMVCVGSLVLMTQLLPLIFN